MIGPFEEVREELGLPPDAVMFARQHAHMVVGLPGEGRVYRIALTADMGTTADPSNVLVAHHRAWEMHEFGLNVLPPTSPFPRTQGRYTISETVMAESLAATGWKFSESSDLGCALASWEHYSSTTLETLDVAGYSTDRVLAAATSHNPHLQQAAEWCGRMLANLQAEYPFQELFDNHPGCVHGDPHMGNLVRIPQHTTPMFIDLDTVKLGPATYDLAIMMVYKRRYNPNYPAEKILASYQRDGSTSSFADALRGLQLWKEASSYTQLLTRWSQPGIREEFFLRASTFSDAASTWNNVIGTPVEQTSG